jgi:hypothetical protein
VYVVMASILRGGGRPANPEKSGVVHAVPDLENAARAPATE